MYLYTGFKSEHLVAFRALQVDNWLRFLLRLNMKLVIVRVYSKIGMSGWVSPAGIPVILLGQFIQAMSWCSNWVWPRTVQHVIKCHNIFIEIDFFFFLTCA